MHLIIFFALQIAKSEGGSNAANQVAYLWAKSLGMFLVN